MKAYKFKNGKVIQKFKKEIFCNFFNAKIEYVAYHKYNDFEVFYTAKDAFEFIKNNQLIINF